MPLPEGGVLAQVVKELKELGFSAADLHAAGFAQRAVDAVDGRPVRALKDRGGYTVVELREYGFVVADLRGVYNVKDMKDSGYSLDDLRGGSLPENIVLAVNGRTTRRARSARTLGSPLPPPFDPLFPRGSVCRPVATSRAVPNACGSGCGLRRAHDALSCVVTITDDDMR